MDAFTDFFPQLAVVVALLVASLALAPVVGRIALPPPAAFLAVGIVAGLAGWASLDDISALRIEQIGAVALYGILFQGGLATGLRAFRANARPITLLGLPGTAATCIGLAVAGHYVLGLHWSLAILVGVALCPTDPAAVYALLRGNTSAARARPILEGESGFNDPVSIALAVGAVTYLGDAGTSVPGAIGTFAAELGIGVLGGMLGGVALLAAVTITQRFEDEVQGIALLAGAVLLGATVATLHGSGFLAVYVAGLVVADRWERQDGGSHVVPEAAAAAAEPVLFGLLGAAFAPLVAGGDIWRGILLTLITVAIVRPIVVQASLVGTGLTSRERHLVNVGGLNGAVPLLLAAYPALEGLPESSRVAGIVLVATAASLVLQSWAVRFIGRQSPEVAHG